MYFLLFCREVRKATKKKIVVEGINNSVMITLGRLVL